MQAPSGPWMNGTRESERVLVFPEDPYLPKRRAEGGVRGSEEHTMERTSSNTASANALEHVKLLQLPAQGELPETTRILPLGAVPAGQGQLRRDDLFVLSLLRGPAIVIDADHLFPVRAIQPPVGCNGWTDATLSFDSTVLVAFTEPSGKVRESTLKLDSHCAMAYDTRSGKFLGRLRATTDRISCVAWHPTRGDLATLSATGHTVLWG